MRIRITPRNRSLYGFVGKLYVLALSHWRVSGVDGRNRLELHFLESALPENSDWICENSRSSGKKPNFDPKPRKTRNDSSYQSGNTISHHAPHETCKFSCYCCFGYIVFLTLI